MNQDIKVNLVWAGGIVVLAIASTLARKAGYLEADTVTRLVIGANGLMIAWMGNRMPKAFVPNEHARRARRVAGWSLALSGLVYAGLFAFAPLSIAYRAGAAAIVLGIAVTIGYCVSLVPRIKAEEAKRSDRA